MCVLEFSDLNIMLFLCRFSNMSVPPSFSDLGKAARDIFSKGFSKYGCGGVSIESRLNNAVVFAEKF